HGRRLAWLGAVGVDVTNLIGAVRRFQLEQPATQWGQPPTVRTNHPPRKRSDRDADKRRGIELVDLIGVRHHGSRTERLYLLAQPSLPGGEKALFTDPHGALERPVFQAHDHDRQVGQVNDRADAEGRERLAGPQFADLAAFLILVVHGAAPSSASSSPPSSSIPKSSRIRFAVGSTSRSELRQ